MFGARGSGKSTLVREVLHDSRTWEINLLLEEDFDRFSRQPQSLITEARARVQDVDWVFIDEVQKLPRMLDGVHALMTLPATSRLKFALTGSSARKLKIAGANLLAGRAFHNELHPLTHLEIGGGFSLDHALNWGTLPRVLHLATELERQEFLRTYVRNYLKEEVWDERLVQNLDPFRKFIEIAAQTSGTIVNFSNIARQTGISDKVAKKYFEILTDTFMGFYLEAYSRSVRSQQIASPKFYFFDPGVKRAAEGMITVPVIPKSFAYGRAFEHFLVCEVMRLNAYSRSDFKLSYLKTKDGAEIDLIIERPASSPVLVEIKSTEEVQATDTSILRRFQQDFPDADCLLWSKDRNPKRFQHTTALHWREGLAEIFGSWEK